MATIADAGKNSRAGAAKSVGTAKSANKRVTEPSYGGTKSSAALIEHAASSDFGSSAQVAGLSMAQRLYNGIDSLGYASSQIGETLQTLGLYEPAPAKAEDLAQAPHHNVVRILNDELNGALRGANSILYEAVVGTDEGDDCDEEEGQEKEPGGPIHKTQYGRTVFLDSQSAIMRLLALQRLANRLNLSLMGVEGTDVEREYRVTDSVYACLDNLLDHINDTTEALHRVNNDLSINLLGSVAK